LGGDEKIFFATGKGAFLREERVDFLVEKGG
jgi:hypothetical protein